MSHDQHSAQPSALTETDFRYLPMGLALEPITQFVAVMRNRYWAVHPERGLLLYVGRRSRRTGSPQCNDLRAIVERLCPPFAEVRFLPVAFIPVGVSGDFDYYVPSVQHD